MSLKSYIFLGIIKISRKLSIPKFQATLSKILKIIISEGLRNRELNYREKARKCLLKVVLEVTPLFLG